MSLNKVMLIGNVGKDPEVRYINNSNPVTKVASFNIATSERYTSNTGEVKENTEWHNIVTWRGLADIVEKYVKKGSQLYIEGRLRTRSWLDQSGNKRYTTEIIADSLQLLGKRNSNESSPSSGSSNFPQQSTNSVKSNTYQQELPKTAYQDDSDQPADDLPF